MLFVRHDQPERVKHDVLLNQCVRADNNIHLMRRKRRRHRCALFIREVPREKAHAHAERREQPRQVVVMLMRKDLRRCHQRPLTAPFHRLDKGEQGDCRLA